MIPNRRKRRRASAPAVATTTSRTAAREAASGGDTDAGERAAEFALGFIVARVSSAGESSTRGLGVGEWGDAVRGAPLAPRVPERPVGHGVSSSRARRSSSDPWGGSSAGANARWRRGRRCTPSGRGSRGRRRAPGERRDEGGGEVFQARDRGWGGFRGDPGRVFGMTRGGVALGRKVARTWVIGHRRYSGQARGTACQPYGWRRAARRRNPGEGRSSVARAPASERRARVQEKCREETVKPNPTRCWHRSDAVPPRRLRREFEGQDGARFYARQDTETRPRRRRARYCARPTGFMVTRSRTQLYARYHEKNIGISHRRRRASTLSL